MSEFDLEGTKGKGNENDNDLNYLLVADDSPEADYKVCIKVVGVGGAGGNAVNNMIKAGLKGVEFYHVNTDFKDLQKSLAPNKIPIGKNLTQGHGTGGDPDIGEKAALENYNAIIDALTGADIVFIAAGMGGGTGTGASAVVAGCANSLNATTIAVVTKPYSWEGQKKSQRADKGISELKKAAATLLVIPNDNLKSCLPEKCSFIEAFKAADDILRQGVQGIADLINKEGIIHRDFGDVKSVLKRGGRAILGIGKAKGESRALEAIKMAANNPLLENTSMADVDKVLLVFSQSIPTNAEMDIAAEHIRSLTSEDCEISFGTFDEDPDSEELCVTVIAASSTTEDSSAEVITMPKIDKSFLDQKLSPTGLVDTVNIEDVELAVEDTPNKTLIRRGNSLFDKSQPTPKPSKVQTAYEVAQIPTKMRIDTTPNFLKKKQV
jgi:cell division protein FtsZ